MISRLGRQINASIERLEKKLKQKNFFLFRLGWALALFLLYLSSAFLSAWSVIFFSPTASFQQFHELNPKKGFEGSYVKHRSWSRRLQLSAVSSILVIVLITVFNGFVLTPRPVKAEVQSFECTGTSGSPLPINPTTGADVTLTGSGYCQLSTAVSLNSLTVQSGVTLTHAAESTTGLDITVATDLNIASGGAISTNAKGCQGGNGGATNGYGPNPSTGICAITTSGYGGAHASGSGAGHGGRGGRGHTDAGGTTYDSSTIPALLGSGGGGGSGPAGGYGGGKIILTVSGTLTVNGNISANGQDGPTTSTNGGGGGSGGSVYISTSSIIGSAAISANGGNGGAGSSYAGGGGGGGRVAVYYNDAGGFTLGNITATKGLAGTGVGARLDGYDGTTYTFQYTVADTPSVTAPVNMSTDSRNPTLTGTSYSSNGAVHTTTDWKITSDPEGSTIVWSKDDDAINLETTTANATNGTFSGALAGATTLVGNTIYHVFVRYTNAAGDSAWSSGNNFITNNTQPVWGGPIIDPGQVPEDGTLFWTFDLDDYCSDADGDALTYSADNDFSLGVMTINPVTHVVTFTLNANANGSDTIRFAGTDGLSSAVLSNAPTITVNAVNDAPVFTKGSNDFAMEDDASRQVNGWATGIGTGGGSDESGQVLTFTVANDNNSLFSVQPDVNESTGNLTYTLASNAFGSATVTVGLSDNGGTANGGDDTSDSQTFTLEATSINDEPSFTAGESQTVYEDTGLYTVATWVVAMSTGPSNESAQTVSFNVTNDDNSLFSVQPAIDSSGALTFTPADNINGSTTVHVTMQDNGGTTNGGDDTSAEQAFTIEISPTNDAPSFTKGADQSAAEDAGAQTVAGWATGMSKGPADESGQTLTFNVSSDNNSLISVQPDIDESTGNLTYTPAANINGSATVTVYLSDDGGVTGDYTSDEQTFTITVNAANDTPVANADIDQSVDESAQSVTSNGANSSDTEVDTLTYTWTEISDSGDACALSATNVVNPTVSLADKESGYACIYRLKVNDGTIDSNNDEITVNVPADNDAPTLPGISDKTVNEGDPLSFAVSADDADTSQLSLSADDAEGDFSQKSLDVDQLFTDNQNNTGTFSWETQSGQSGGYVLEVQATDAENVVSDLVNITVVSTTNNDDDSDEEIPENSAPVFAGALPDVSFYAGTTTSVLFTLSDYFTDVDNDELTYTTTGLEHLQAEIDADSKVTLTAPASFSGTETIYFTATDSAAPAVSSNVVVMTVSETIPQSDINHVTGSSKGKGLIVVTGNEGQILASWQAFTKGGVVPRLETINGNTYIFAIKRTPGSTIHIYTSQGNLLKKKRLAPKLHYRRFATGNLDSNDSTIEMAIATKRGTTIYFKIFSFNPSTKQIVLKKRAKYKPLPGKNYRTTIQKQRIKLIDNNGQTKFVWKPF